jgi:hypothetical protein
MRERAELPAVREPLTMALWPVAYLAAIVVAEIISSAVDVRLGAVVNAMLVVALSVHGGLAGDATLRRALPILALLPLIRLVSVGMSLSMVPESWWYAAAGVPVLTAAVLAARFADFSPSTLGFGRARPLPQLLIALTGMPLSDLALRILGYPPALDTSSRTDLVLAVVGVVVFVGLTEELVFRGLLQRSLVELFGEPGVVAAAVAFGIFHLGTLSAPYAAFMLGVGLFFGWCVHRTGSLWGVVGAHALFALLLLVMR